MILPKIRLSDLEKEVREKKAALDESQEAATYHIRQKLKPVHFFSDHRKLLLTTLFTAIPVWKFLFKVGGKTMLRKKSSLLWNVLKAGWTWKALMKGGGFLFKHKRKDLFNLGASLLKTFNKK